MPPLIGLVKRSRTLFPTIAGATSEMVGFPGCWKIRWTNPIYLFEPHGTSASRFRSLTVGRLDAWPLLSDERTAVGTSFLGLIGSCEIPRLSCGSFSSILGVPSSSGLSRRPRSLDEHSSHSKRPLRSLAACHVPTRSNWEKRGRRLGTSVLLSLALRGRRFVLRSKIFDYSRMNWVGSIFNKSS